MQTLNRTYKFRSRILPDGHLSVPDEISRATDKEFEVTITPIDDIKSIISRYLDGQIEKRGRITDISLNSEDIEEAVKITFGTSNIDEILQSIRR
jgi:hypothetical protein